MASSTKNPLEAAKVKTAPAAGDPREPHVQAKKLLDQVRAELPGGVPADSPIAKLERDAMLQLAAQSNLPIAPLLAEDELRLVLHWGTVKLSQAPHISAGRGSRPIPPPPEVPLQPPSTPRPGRLRSAGAPPSESGKWLVIAAPLTPVSAAGQLCTLRPGSIIEARHYAVGTVDSLWNQGVDLEPIAPDPAPEPLAAPEA